MLHFFGPPALHKHSRPAPTRSEVVTITGIRRAIESAIAVKKEASSIVEAITSEDLGKLPDPSIADSISRLPGVAAQRNKGSGKAQQISVRGMSPDFNGAMLNGREVASSGDSRGVDLDLYPGELLKRGHHLQDAARGAVDHRHFFVDRPAHHSGP